MLQRLPSSAESYAVDQRSEIGAAVSAVLRQWRAMGENFDASWLSVGPQIVATMDVAQERVTTGALNYVPAVLEQTGQTRSLSPRYDIAPTTLVGVSGDGLPTESLAYGAVLRAKALVGGGEDVGSALRRAGEYLSTAVGTMLSDTGRTAEKMAAQARPVTGYVRMLQAPSCGRCVILAGRRTRAQTAFLRHPRCDCRNIPASESVASDLTVNPREYLDNLDSKGLAQALGSKANAQAYTEGADLNQLINAYRRSGDVRSAQVYGRTVKYTTEGTTRRGSAHRAMLQAKYVRAAGEPKRGRYLALRAPRLMPESIYQIATSRADADRLLRLYGWIL